MRACVYLTTVVLIIGLGGCSFHYYDKKTDTEHIVGFGHMSMKLSKPEEEVRAAVKGVDVYGLGISHVDEDFSFVCGWHSKTRLEVINENTSVSLKWPNNDLFNVRVGSKPPFLEDERIVQQVETKKGGDK